MTGNNDANKPAAERVYDPGRPNAERLAVLARALVRIVKRHDATRPVTAALAFPELSNRTGFADALDVVGYNYKEHLYAQDHASYPDRPLLGSENGKHLEAWLAARDQAFIGGQFLWTGIDYLGETHGWPSHGSHAGLLDVAGFEKPSYYFRQSLWAEKPVLQLAAAYPSAEGEPEWKRRQGDRLSWNFLPGAEVDVVCYTNCERAELFLNGKSLGARSMKDHQKDGYLSWRVPFEPGTLRAVGVAPDGSTVESALTTHGSMAAIRARALQSALAADGQDMTHVEIEIIDCEGRIVEDAEPMIEATIEGPGVLLGLENGNLEDTLSYAHPYRRAYRGRLLAYIGAGCEAGVIRLRLAAEGVAGAGVEIAVG